MVITKMLSKYNQQLTDFLYEHNKLKEHFIAWIPEEYGEISVLDKNNFILCVEDDKIVGCLGAYISHEQRVARLLGPVILEDYFNKYVDKLFGNCLEGLPEDVDELKIAFFAENTLCKSWCESNGFELYNAERTMVYRNASCIEHEATGSVMLKPYEPIYKDGLQRVHPEDTFFTLNELVEGISERRRLLLAIVQDKVMGYVCFEQTGDKKHGEIILLHVGSGQRNKGYGTLLLKQALDTLRANNIEQVMINVRANNHLAHKLYERFGFTDKETVYAYRKQA